MVSIVSTLRGWVDPQFKYKTCEQQFKESLSKTRAHLKEHEVKVHSAWQKVCKAVGATFEIKRPVNLGERVTNVINEYERLRRLVIFNYARPLDRIMDEMAELGVPSAKRWSFYPFRKQTVEDRVSTLFSHLQQSHQSLKTLWFKTVEKENELRQARRALPAEERPPEITVDTVEKKVRPTNFLQILGLSD